MLKRALFAIGICLLLSACQKGCSFKVPQYAPTQLELLVLKLDSRYVRAFGPDDFALNYRSKNPNSVIIVVKFTAKTDRYRMQKVVESARSTVKGIAADQYGLQNVSINVVYEKVDAKTFKSIESSNNNN